MEVITSKEYLEELIKGNEMLLVYFGNTGCNVCNAIKPKIEELIKAYPNVKGVQIDAERSIEISSAYSIFTIPAVLLFIVGKEVIREARYISINDVESKIERYYNMIFE